jgi:DNA-binding MarR family transcriptional regulator
MEIARKSGFEEREPSCTAADALTTLERITDRVRREIHLFLREHGMTTTQYNVLRVLRCAEPGGLSCSELGTRLAGADPDITRILDRLARHGLVRRHRDARDRRAVLTEITEEGARMLDSVEPLLDARIATLFGHMPPARLQLLVDLLHEAMPSAKRNGERTSQTIPVTKAG